MAPVQEANSDNLGNFFSIFNTMIVCYLYSLESPFEAILTSTHNIQFHDKIKNKNP